MDRRSRRKRDWAVGARMIGAAANGDGGHRMLRQTGAAASGSPFLKRVPLAAFQVGRSFRRRKFPLAAVGCLLLGLLCGCSTVKPWERDVLSLPGMQMDPHPLISACDDHIYFSREASKGGRSFGGGGCGCN